MKKTYAIVNLLVILAVIFWNYYSNTGAINGNSVGQISDKYPNLFTPAGYAFSIWGLIFLGLIISGIYQLRIAFKEGKESDVIFKIGPWLTMANLGNAAWLWFWLNEFTGGSVLIMLLILFSLLQIVVRLNMERENPPRKTIAFIWWPVSIYAGWITVATIANISAWLVSLEINFLFSEVVWTIIMISIAAVLNLYMIYSRNMREFALVGVWALVAIAVRHWGEIPVLQWTAIFWSLLLLAAVIQHGYKNRKENAFFQYLNSASK